MSIDKLKCYRCQSEGVIGGPEAGRTKFLESAGWRKIGGQWVCGLCTGITLNHLNQAMDDGFTDVGGEP